MKHQSLFLGILLTQAWMPSVAAKSLSLYRIESSSTSPNEKNTRQLATSNDIKQSAESGSDEYVEDFSDELYDEAHVPNERMLYQIEVEKLVKERREMFARNLVSMSTSLSFSVIIAPPSDPEPSIIESGEQDESSYDILRAKLLGDDAKDEDDESSIDKANDLASSGEGKVSGLLLTEAVETESDYSAVIADSKTGYVMLRAKLLGKAGDEEFAEDIDEEIDKANELAAKKDIVGGGSKKSLRRR
jgi:hypothetical protein